MADYRQKALLRSATQKLYHAIDELLVFVEQDYFPFDEEFVDDLIEIEKAVIDELSREEEEEEDA